MKLESLLLPFALFFSQSQVNPLPKEKVDRYVELAKQGKSNLDIDPHLDQFGRPLYETNSTSIDYHGSFVHIQYLKTIGGHIGVRTVIQDNSVAPRSTLVFLEQNYIDGTPEKYDVDGTYLKNFMDGIPEIVAGKDWVQDSSWSGYFKDRNEQSKRKLLNRYHQIIYYVVDSLLKRK